MLKLALDIAFLMFGLAMLLSGWRLMKGPRAADRVLALDSLTTCLMALVLLVGLWVKSETYIEVALLIALLGFAATVALALALPRGGDPR
jgi:multicomponent K+:H+ antiporter subunit F